jgi:hypothetical protein
MNLGFTTNGMVRRRSRSNPDGGYPEAIASLMAALVATLRPESVLILTAGLTNSDGCRPPQPKSLFFQQLPQTLQPSEFVCRGRLARHSAENRVWLLRSSGPCSRCQLSPVRNDLDVAGNRILAVWFRGTLLTGYNMR